MEWISAKEQVPTTDERVLCQTVTKKGAVNMIIGYFADGRWCCGMNSNVVAWARLPEPYEEKPDRLLYASEVVKTISGLTDVPKKTIEDILIFAASAKVPRLYCARKDCKSCVNQECWAGAVKISEDGCAEYEPKRENTDE